MEGYDIVLIVLICLAAVGLFLVAGLAEKLKSSMWRVIYLIPLIIIWLIMMLNGYCSDLLPVYLAGFIMAVGFFLEKKKVREIISCAGGVLALVAVVCCLVDPGYRMPSFAKDFEEVYADLKAHYCLTIHKGIDWESLYEEYLPKFRQADKDHSYVENCIAWREFTAEFYDTHTYYDEGDEAVSDQADDIMYGNDYGYSMMELTGGKVVAICVESGSQAQQAGMETGTEILSLDGKSIEEWKKEVKYMPFTFPDAENENFYKAMMVAGLGGDQVTVCFRNRAGEEQTAVLNKIGPYWERLENAFDTVNQGRNIGTLTFEELDEDTVLYRVKGMFYDTKSYEDGDFGKMEQEIREGLSKYKEMGKKKLIIDLRSNTGGSPDMIKTMAKLLAPEGEHFFMNMCKVDETTGAYVYDAEAGKYVVESADTYMGENLWEDREIVILVNALCVSAGDIFTDKMRGFPNVTVMGFTKSSGAGQAVGTKPIHTGRISYSFVPSLDQDGSIYIDSGTDHVAKVGVDVQIPFDETAVDVLFNQKEDYVLKKAMEYEK